MLKPGLFLVHMWAWIEAMWPITPVPLPLLRMWGIVSLEKTKDALSMSRCIR